LKNRAEGTGFGRKKCGVLIKGLFNPPGSSDQRRQPYSVKRSEGRALKERQFGYVWSDGTGDLIVKEGFLAIGN